MTATTATAPQPNGPAGRTAGPAAPAGPGSLTYYQLPDPLRDRELLFFDANALQRVLEGTRHGLTPERAALGTTQAPDERAAQALEARVRRRLRARARGAAGWSIFYWLLGPALALLWINLAPLLAAAFFWFPPLAALVGTLGGISGGLALVAVVALAPLVWAWRRALRRAGDARRWGRLARLLGARRFRDAPLARAESAELAAFAAAGRSQLERLRALAPTMEEKGADAAAEAAALARTLYRLAIRHGLGSVAGAFHAIYTRMESAEQRLSKLEGAGSGVFAERKAIGEMRRARREASAVLAPYSPSTRAPGNLLAPLWGLVGGLAALALTLLITGTYWVAPDQAVIVDSPSARLARAASALGVGGTVADLLGTDDQPQVVRGSGFQWGWPRPIAARHAITLGEQRVQLHAIFRQTGPDAFDGIVVELRFRVTDPQQWAARDRDGMGADQLSAELSSVLQDILQRARRDARQAVLQQNPGLANDQQQVAARADQLVQSRLDELVRVFVQAVGSTDTVKQAGIQVNPDARWRMVNGIPGDVARPMLEGQ